MIAPNELRIGNIVLGIKREYLNGAPITVQNEVVVTNIQESGINFDFIANEIGFLFNDIKPIPLTEERLLKFGFVNCIINIREEIYPFDGMIRLIAINKGSYWQAQIIRDTAKATYGITLS